MKDLKNKIEELIDASEYDKACTLLQEKFKISYTCEFLKNDYHFVGDKDKRDIYKIQLKKGNREYVFNFGQSIVNSGFYVKYGNRNVEIDRKYLQKEFKPELIKHINSLLKWDYQPNTDLLHYPKEPRLYDIITCLTKYDPGTFEDFCSEFGYDEDSKKAEKIYNAVRDEYLSMCSLFSDEELEILSLIN